METDFRHYVYVLITGITNMNMVTHSFLMLLIVVVLLKLK